MSDDKQKPANEDVFEKALRLLYERRLIQFGLEADIIITKVENGEIEEAGE